MIHSLFIRLVAIAGLTVAWPHAQGTGSVVDIGSRRELMVDRFLIERLQGTTLRLQTPQPGGIAVKYDRPWEDRFCFYTTVLKDGDKYLMYYRSYSGSVINQGEGNLLRREHRRNSLDQAGPGAGRVRRLAQE